MGLFVFAQKKRHSGLKLFALFFVIMIKKLIVEPLKTNST